MPSSSRWELEPRERVDALVQSMFDGTYAEPTPSLVRLTGAHKDVDLLVEGQLYSLVGESGAGKSWFACQAALQTLRDGHAVFWFDFEMSLERVLFRLITIGVTKEELAHFHYSRPDALVVSLDTPIPLELPTIGGHYASLVQDEVAAGRKVLVLIDSLNASIALLENSTDHSAEDITRWVNAFPGPLRDAGAAVLWLDHYNKSNVGTSNASGSWKKRAVVDAQFTLLKGVPFSREREGHSLIDVYKPRDGYYPEGRIGKMSVTLQPMRITLTYEVLEGGVVSTEHRIRKDIMTYLEGKPDGASLSAVRREVKGFQEKIASELHALVSNGYAHSRRNKNNTGDIYSFVKSYNPDDTVWLDAQVLDDDSSS